MENGEFLSAAIVTYNDAEKAPKACKSILQNTKKYPVNLTVIDNASADNTVNEVLKCGAVSVIKQTKNEGFGKAHNKVLSTKLGKYHFVINPDITFSGDLLSQMADYFDANPDVVMACPKILNTDGTEQKLPKSRPTAKRLFLGRLCKKIRQEYVWAQKEITEPCDIDFCTGCFFCIRSDVFKACGGFDERFFMYLEDAELTERAKAHGRVVILPQFCVTHEWERQSAKSPKYFFIHLISCIKFLNLRRKRQK